MKLETITFLGFGRGMNYPINKRGIGGLGRAPFQKKLIEDAVFYRYCVTEKLIADTTPIMSVVHRI